MSKERVLVVASAGGHLTQAMCATRACSQISLVSNKRNISDRRIKRVYEIRDTQHNPIIHFINIFFAVYVLVRERPNVVFSTGGPIVLPFALLCKILPIKFVYLDTLSRVVELSNTGKLIKKHNLYNEFFCQWQQIAERNNASYIGKCFDILCENTYKPITKKVEDVPVILVTVGTNQYGFDRLFNILAAMPLYADERVRWVIQASHNKVNILPANGKVVEMISRDEMEGLVKEASLVISHCGIGSINLMLSYQKQVIFVPRVAKYDEFSDDHQLQIANEIGSDLFSVVLPDTVMPTINYEVLVKKEILIEPVDTTNHEMANLLKKKFFA